MSETEVVMIIMGSVAIIIGISFLVVIFFIYKHTKKKIHNDKKIQSSLKKIADDYRNGNLKLK